jgi:ADP-ribosyl-[dinitrogen reductase] hydrolase
LDAAEAAAGSILGTAVGDAVGLPCEGLSKRRQARFKFSLNEYALLPGRGMCSDDTDHACMVAQALAASGGDPKRFASSLAWRLRFWFLGLPAGIGFATLRAIFKLWLFIPPRYSGVFSAGNGPAMRVALLGVAFAHDEQLLVEHVAACTRITHTDPKAMSGAMGVALAARGGDFMAGVRKHCEPEFIALAERAVESARKGESTEAFAASIGCENGVSGYIYHSVPVALHAWLAHPRDLEAAIGAAIRCGGDSDTVGAITGAIVGAGVGPAGIAPARLEKLWDWPRGAAWMEKAARNGIDAAKARERRSPLFLFGPFILVKNLFFLVVVLLHGFRRLAPPY